MQMLLPDGSNPKACSTSAVICGVAAPHASKIVAALVRTLCVELLPALRTRLRSSFYQARFAEILRITKM
jgi:hypothetical protein